VSAIEGLELEQVVGSESVADGPDSADLGLEVEQIELTQRPVVRRFLRYGRPIPALRQPSSTPITEGEASPETTLREGLYRRTLALADGAAALLLLVVFLPVFGQSPPLLVSVIAVPVLVLLGKLTGLYERDEVVLNKSTLDETPLLLQVTGLFTFLISLYVAAATPTGLNTSDAVTLWALAFTLVVTGRLAARWAVGRIAATERCLIVGEAASIALVRSKLASAHLNTEVVATLSTEDSVWGLSSASELLALFRELVRRHAVHRVIIAPGPAAGVETAEMVRAAKHSGVRVSLLPRMIEVVGSTVKFDHVAGLTMLGVPRFGLSRSSRLVKRAFDLLGATVLLVATAPLMIAIALAVKFDPRAPGPVFFRQTRVGKDGRRFELIKYRSMRVGADEGKEALRHLNTAVGLFKVPDDPRITPIGRLLRKTSLDELPQLINVWCGEMSLVGPRPLVVDEDEQVEGFDRQRLHLTPGMTGHWQILGSARVPMHEMVSIDYLYVANWSLWGDVKILLRTIPYVLACRGM
jgi:exopolysaccharide biosynthesis polyprenyl glycosylphosphotransferase